MQMHHTDTFPFIFKLCLFILLVYDSFTGKNSMELPGRTGQRLKIDEQKRISV